MGLKNGGAIFQRMMEWILGKKECADPYIDDVIIGSTGFTEEEAFQNHIIDLRKVLDRLREQKMLVNPAKAHFFMREVEFCGHILKEGRRQPAPGKLMSIQKWELPQTVTQLRGFLGLTNYYSSYVEHYAQYAGPLMSKLQLKRDEGRKGSQVKLVWTREEVEAFENLKKVLAQSLELFIMDPDKPFILRTDASDKAIGAVLEQDRTLTPGGELKRVPVGFFSRKLCKSQLNWTPREKETYAIVSALQKWAGWIGLQPVTVLTDHKSLEHWVEEKRDTPSGPSGRRGRWHELLSKFDLTIQYIPGKDNVVADALSRFAYPAAKAFQDTSFHGSEQARLEMKEIVEEEREEERQMVRPVTTRSRANQQDPEEEEEENSEESEEEILELTQPTKVTTKPITTPTTTTTTIPTTTPATTSTTTTTTGTENIASSSNALDSIPQQPKPIIIEVPKNENRPKGVARPPAVESWEESYDKCPHWGPKWKATQDPVAEWPKGIQLHMGRMIWDGRVAVPTDRVKEVTRGHHNAMGHPGIAKLEREVKRRYALPPSLKVRELVREDRMSCVVCQACDHPNFNMETALEYTPIPTYVMDHVSIDIFSLPSTEFDGKTFDAMVLCVDRQSGWMIARPCTKLGLTAERAARLLLDGGWEIFGIPSVVTSDQGPQFTGQWWKTMCAKLGVRMAYAQAYRPDSNGRAEIAGKSLIGRLRKLQAEDKISWVEALPRALWAYHNTPGESGLSPFQIVFGRERGEAGTPTPEIRECESAKMFFENMNDTDQKIANIMNEKHEKKQEKSENPKRTPLYSR